MTKYRLKQIFQEILFDTYSGCVQEEYRDDFKKIIRQQIITEEGSQYDEEMEILMDWFHELFDNAKQCEDENV